MNNVYVAGNTAFPAASQANPALTIVASATRLADHLSTIANGVPSRQVAGQSAMVS
jgi:choline dehydrogenase-like flavoprotein